MKWERPDASSLVCPPYLILRVGCTAFPERTYLPYKLNKDYWECVGGRGYDTGQEAKDACESDAKQNEWIDEQRQG